MEKQNRDTHLMSREEVNEAYRRIARLGAGIKVHKPRSLDPTETFSASDYELARYMNVEVHEAAKILNEIDLPSKLIIMFYSAMAGLPIKKEISYLKIHGEAAISLFVANGPFQKGSSSGMSCAGYMLNYINSGNVPDLPNIKERLPNSNFHKKKLKRNKKPKRFGKCK